MNRCLISNLMSQMKLQLSLLMSKTMKWVKVHLGLVFGTSIFSVCSQALCGLVPCYCPFLLFWDPNSHSLFMPARICRQKLTYPFQNELLFIKIPEAQSSPSVSLSYINLFVALKLQTVLRDAVIGRKLIMGERFRGREIIPLICKVCGDVCSSLRSPWHKAWLMLEQLIVQPL